TPCALACPAPQRLISSLLPRHGSPWRGFLVCPFSRAQRAAQQAAQLVGPVAGTPGRDPPERLGNNSGAHLRMPFGPLNERDGYFNDRSPGPMDPPGHINLKAIPVGGDGLQVKFAQNVG